MTDITKLAQSLKTAANKAGADEWQAKKISGEFYVIRKGSYSSKCGYRTYQPIAEIDHKSTRDYVAISSPANILSLVEALEKAQHRNGELESRTVTVKLPPELYKIGELIRTQDNRITDQPMFVVFQKREIIGSDEHSPSRICWVWDGEEVSELRAKRLEALYQDGRDTRGYDRYAMQEVDEFVTACFTEHGCKDYLRQNGHNLRLPYIYACGSFRNNEYQLVRNWLAGIKWEAE